MLGSFVHEYLIFLFSLLQRLFKSRDTRINKCIIAGIMRHNRSFYHCHLFNCRLFAIIWDSCIKVGENTATWLVIPPPQQNPVQPTFPVESGCVLRYFTAATKFLTVLS